MLKTIDIGELTEQQLRDAIERNKTDRDALTILICDTFTRLKDAGIKVKGFYYDPYWPLSSDEFDMFSFKGLISLFNIFGYETEMVQTGDKNDISFGDFIVSKGDFKFKMRWEEDMHDSLYSDFVDAKTAVIIE